MTAAGLVFDAATLTYFGVGTLGLMVALALWNWARTPATALATISLRSDLPSMDMSASDRVVFALERARDNARIADSVRGKQRSRFARQAFHEMEAAILSAKKQFGIRTPGLKWKGTIAYENLLEAHISLIDRILPLLRDGHVEEANNAASRFSWVWEEYD